MAEEFIKKHPNTVKELIGKHMNTGGENYGKIYSLF
jgi:ABC-type nitrate/sulfonate/bicarbonate transport system substrate-binding protein